MSPSEANTRSRARSLADKAVQKKKRIANEDKREHVEIEGQKLDNVYSFEYLRSRTQCDGDEKLMCSTEWTSRRRDSARCTIYGRTTDSAGR